MEKKLKNGRRQSPTPSLPPRKKKWHTNYTKPDIKVSRPVQYCPINPIRDCSPINLSVCSIFHSNKFSYKQTFCQTLGEISINSFFKQLIQIKRNNERFICYLCFIPANPNIRPSQSIPSLDPFSR